MPIRAKLTGHIAGIVTIGRTPIVVLFFLGSIPIAWSQEPKPPSASELIGAAIKDCGEPTTRNTIARSEIARAFAYRGDFAAARDVLKAHDVDMFIDSAYCTVIELEAAKGKTIEPQPSAFKDILPDCPQFAVVCAYAKAGRTEKLLEQLRELPTTRGSTLKSLAYQIVEPLWEAGKRDVAREVLVRWSECFGASESLFDYRPTEKIEQLISQLHQCGESARAKALCERWQGVMTVDTDVEENGGFIGRGWGQLGRSWALIGEKEKAQEAIRQARVWLDKARAAKFDSNKPHDCIDFARAYAGLAARITAVLGDEAALETLHAAWQHALLAVSSNYEYFGFEEIIKEQLEADDFKGANRTIEHVVSHRSRAKCWSAISEYARKHGRTEEARAAAKAAAQELDRDGFKAFMAHDMAKVASSVALAGEADAARRLFTRAKGLSEADEDAKSYHSWIARMQVHGGLLTDAYATIRIITLPDDRAWPLAELAREAAKKENNVLINKR